MRTSCNGCRVLRKGCSDDCVIRPCLVWMKSADAQANATVFLAKFYGRAGLLNLLNAGPDHLRPGIFQSLLYEACGRVVDPIYGSVGLLYSGQWHHCQLAVDAVLKGLPIIQLSPSSHLITSPPNNNNNAAPPINTTTTSPSSNSQFMLMPPLNKLYDIRHMSSKDNQSPPTSVIPTGPRLKPRPHLPAFDPGHDCDDVSTAAGDDSTEGSSSIAGCHNNNNNVHLELTLGFTKLNDMQY